MHFKPFSMCTLFFLLTVPSLQAKIRKLPAVKAKVHFLAEGAMIRGGSIHQDVFLAEFSSASDPAPTQIIFIDQYLFYQTSLPWKQLGSADGTSLKIVRDAKCDLRASDLVLRAAPGDMTAILPIRLHYELPVELRQPSDTVLPCYRRVRTGRE